MSVSSLRPAVAVVLCAGIAFGSSAVAAPKKAAAPAPVCNLIVDAKGDDGGPVFKHSDTLDIVSADMASSAKVVTAAIRVVKYAKTDTSAAPTGRGWYLDFNVPGGATALWLGAQSTATGGETFSYGWVDGTIHRALGTASGTFDEAKSEVRITAPIDAWADRGTVKVGSAVSGLAAATYNVVGAYANGSGAASLQPGDTATAAKPYTAGAPSCVTPGA